MIKIYKQKPFYFSCLVLIILVALHFTGSYYSLYWKFFWFDILVHVISGLWVALLILWLLSVFEQINFFKKYKVKLFLVSFLSAAIFGVLWELVENFYELAYISADGYYLDTVLDILSDCLGGILAFFYFIRRKKSIKCDQENIHPFYNQVGLIKN